MATKKIGLGQKIEQYGVYQINWHNDAYDIWDWSGRCVATQFDTLRDAIEWLKERGVK